MSAFDWSVLEENDGAELLEELGPECAAVVDPTTGKVLEIHQWDPPVDYDLSQEANLYSPRPQARPLFRALDRLCEPERQL